MSWKLRTTETKWLERDKQNVWPKFVFQVLPHFSKHLLRAADQMGRKRQIQMFRKRSICHARLGYGLRSPRTREEEKKIWRNIYLWPLLRSPCLLLSSLMWTRLLEGRQHNDGNRMGEVGEGGRPWRWMVRCHDQKSLSGLQDELRT